MSDDFEAIKTTDAINELRDNFTSTDKFSKHLLKTIETQAPIRDKIKQLAKESCIETIKENKSNYFDKTIKPAIFILVGCFATFLFKTLKYFILK